MSALDDAIEAQREVDAEARKRRQGSESAIQSAILQYLKARRVFCWRQNVGGIVDGRGRYVQFGLTGCSDILGIMPGGRFLAIEVKTPKGRVSPAQDKFRRNVEGSGGLYILARSIDDVAERL